MLHSAPGGRLSGHLRGERRRLPRALEPDLAGRGPGDHAPRRIGDGHDGVVERALDVGVPVSNVLSFLAAYFLDAGTALGRHPAPWTLEVVGPLLVPYCLPHGTARDYFLPVFFLPATVFFLPFLVRALVCVR